MRYTTWLKAAVAALALAPTAYSFCGFYVAQEPGSLFNKSSKVVLVRDGDRTVITMANDYQGDPSEFGLVVPVPQEIEPEMVKIAERSIIDKLDQYSVPRLAEYFDPDPCPPRMREERKTMSMAPMSAPPPTMAVADAADRDFGVTVEKAFSLEEYDITIIRAKGGDGLEQWLRKEGYRIPDGATDVLESYVRQDMHFFLAKIDLRAQEKLGVKWPRPLRVEYHSRKFMLPIRLGTVNADGAQDLLVFALSPQARVETTNYRAARMPTDLEVPEYLSDGGNFATFYTAMFDRRVRRDDMRAVYLEYAWPMQVVCDPCAGDQLTGAELQALGANWAQDYHGGMSGGFLTRLHVRYDRRHFPEDLVFQETADAAPWQARYVVNHAWRGNTNCAEGRRYLQQLAARQTREVTTLHELTGWSSEDIQRFVPGRGR
ncbi:MAG: DUF2330 domain-containing protein [Myxococcota bacterium]